MNERWRKLRVGDRIRIVRMPSETSMDGYKLPRDTRRLYKLLIARKKVLHIHEIDKRWKLPWVWCRLRQKNGRLEQHLLAVNDDSWEPVKSRR